MKRARNSARPSHLPHSEEPVIISGFHHGAPPLRFCQIFLCTGIVSIAVALWGKPDGWRPSESGPFSLGLLFFGVLFLSLGGILAKVRRDILRLSSSEQLCKRMGMDERTLYRQAEVEGIRPRYIVNGKEYYDPADFATHFQLLRASQPPAPRATTLLRPAEATEPRENRLLLRHSAPESSSATASSDRGYPTK